MHVTYNHRLAKYLEVYCNGEKLLRCFKASEEDGKAHCYTSSSEGVFPKEYTRAGTVEIRLKADAPEWARLAFQTEKSRAN